MADKEEEISSVPPSLRASKKMAPEQSKTAMKMRTVSGRKTGRRRGTWGVSSWRQEGWRRRRRRGRNYFLWVLPDTWNEKSACRPAPRDREKEKTHQSPREVPGGAGDQDHGPPPRRPGQGQSQEEMDRHDQETVLRSCSAAPKMRSSRPHLAPTCQPLHLQDLPVLQVLVQRQIPVMSV